MKHPLFSPVRNIVFYLIGWGAIILAHAFILNYYAPVQGILAWTDALFFNVSFAAFGMGIWYAVYFLKISKGEWGNVFINHLAAICIFLTLWISLGNFILSLFSDNPDYRQFLKDAVPFRFFTGLMYYLVVVFFYYSFSYYLSARENLLKASELKSLVKETQLELLKNQMNPHFIFNSLNSISALTSINPAKAREMIVALSSFLRYSLAQKPDQLIPFSEELENGLIYLNIEKMRFGDKLVFTSKINSGTENVMIPGMILQPVLENAVKHGAYESSESG